MDCTFGKLILPLGGQGTVGQFTNITGKRFRAPQWMYRTSLHFCGPVCVEVQIRYSIPRAPLMTWLRMEKLIKISSVAARRCTDLPGCLSRPAFLYQMQYTTHYGIKSKTTIIQFVLHMQKQPTQSGTVRHSSPLSSKCAI